MAVGSGAAARRSHACNASPTIPRGAAVVAQAARGRKQTLQSRSRPAELEYAMSGRVSNSPVRLICDDECVVSFNVTDLRCVGRSTNY